jgi:hypothetical protein
MSRDEGVTWKKLTGHGLPMRMTGKWALAIARSNPNRIYAMIETGDGVPLNGQETDRGKLWRSDDGGENWQLGQLRSRHGRQNALLLSRGSLSRQRKRTSLPHKSV